MPLESFTATSVGLLSPLRTWLDDKQVSEILINKPGEIWVEKSGQLKRHRVDALNTYHLNSLFKLLAKENNQSLNDKNPLFAGNLLDGSRVHPHGGYSPISLPNHINIRER